MKAMRSVVMGAVVALVGACGPATVEPSLFLSVSPKTLRGAQVATVKVSATDSKDKPGTGTVRVTSTAGSLVDGTDVDLQGGEGEVSFTCDNTVDATCAGSVRLNGDWNGATASTSLTVSAMGTGGGNGGGGGTGGGAGEDAGSPVDGGVLVYQPDSTTAAGLTIQSTGIGTSTPVFFKVIDSSGMGVEGVDVAFSIKPNSAAGCTVAPSARRTNSMGLAQTTLSSGDSQGSATVVARVTGLPAAESASISIVIGRPNDGSLSLNCSKRNLGALQTPGNPPRNDQMTVCTLNFTDRNANKTPYSLNASWYAEAGQVDPLSVAVANSGFATSNFNSGGSLPVETSPMAGEPTNGAKNPRDMIVGVIASVPGEEQFWDGSGGQAANGVWDPGEWFVDVPEPFVDSNDNGRYDPGEPYGDTDRYDCATKAIVPKNNHWDGPNGCWDANTQIWRATHIAYTGDLDVTRGPTFTPPLPTAPMAPNAVFQTNFGWTDEYFNRLSNDGVNAQITTISGMRGSATVSPITGENFNQRIEYVTIAAVESAPGSGVFTEIGTCDKDVADAGYPLTRCLRTYKFSAWNVAPTGGRITITAPSDTSMTGTTSTRFELSAGNNLQSNPSTSQFVVQFQ